MQFKMYPVFVLIRYGKTSDTEMIVMNKEYKLIDPWKHEACRSTQGHTGKYQNWPGGREIRGNCA